MSRPSVTKISKRPSLIQRSKESLNSTKTSHVETLQKTNKITPKVASNLKKTTSPLLKSKESLIENTKPVLVEVEEKIPVKEDTSNSQPEQDVDTAAIKLSVTDFSNRTGSPFQKEPSTDRPNVLQEEVVEKTSFERHKEKQNKLIQKVNKKTADYQSSKPCSGFFTEVVTHGAFTSRSANVSKSPTPVKSESPQPPKANGSSSSKAFLGFPSSANDLALDAKSDLESDPNISIEVKEKVIDKLFALVSMVQHVYESKVRIMTEFEKYKDTHSRNEFRREKEHSEQLYKLNMNFQNEVVQAIQRLKSELDISRNVSNNVEGSNSSLNNCSKDTSIDFNTSDDTQESELKEKGIDTVEGVTDEPIERVESENAFSDIKNDDTNDD